jgi:uncharacterized damage-inducible protein DinB
MKTRRSAITLLLHSIDEAYDRTAWHGTNLRGSLRGVTARQADRRPGPGRHNIRELVVHAAYWKHRVRSRLSGEKRGSFPIPGRDWLALPPASEKTWQAERELLDTEHRALRNAVAGFPVELLERRLPGSRSRTALREIAGIALHDAYHTGQIQLVKVMLKKGGRR